jgi:hypothetical protein
MTALLVTQLFDGALLWAARHARQCVQWRRHLRTETALLVTHEFDSALLWAAQARSSMRAMVAAFPRRVNASLATHSFNSALLWEAQARS